jgi:hypothetical protein
MTIACNFPAATECHAVSILGGSDRLDWPNFGAVETRTTFASASAALSYFASQTIRPWCVRLERAFQASVLSNRYRLHFDLNALLAADPAANAGALLKLRQGGLLTANEGRMRLGLPAHADGNSITPPSVMSGRAEAADAPPADRKIVQLEDRHAAD